MQAASQQATAITEISQAASKVDRSTHHNAARAEEGAVSAYSLTEQANNLENYVSQLQAIVYGASNAPAAAGQYASANPCPEGGQEAPSKAKLSKPKAKSSRTVAMK